MYTKYYIQKIVYFFISISYKSFMSVETLNAKIVKQKISERGWTRKWVISQLCLGPEGYKILRGEWLPKRDSDRKSRVLHGLAKLLDLEVSQILVGHEAKKAS
jgi:hypothetical protein